MSGVSASLPDLLAEVQTWHAGHYARWAEWRDRLRAAVEEGDPFSQTGTLFEVVLAREARDVNRWVPVLDELHAKLAREDAS